jgi:hypothetical protein
MTFQLDMEVFKNINVRWLPPGNAVAVDEIACRNQKTVYEEAMSGGHIEIGMRQVATECTPRDPYRRDCVMPRGLATPLDTPAPNPLNGLGLAGNSQGQISDSQIFDRSLSFRSQDLRSPQKAVNATAALALGLALSQRTRR